MADMRSAAGHDRGDDKNGARVIADSDSGGDLDDLPKAYREGQAVFYGMDFVVSPDVLIPRPETEQMVDAVLNLAGVGYLPGVKPGARMLPERAKILDVGTGSGCLAVTIKKKLPDSTVYGVDVSEAAFDIARENARRMLAEVDFFLSDLLSSVEFVPDVVVANLPYVDADWDWLDKRALSCEPRVALYADDHGLELIKQLIMQSSEKKIQFLLLEADPCQHESVIDFAATHGYKLFEVRGFILVFFRS